MRVLFIEPYPTEGPSSRYRVEQYIPYLLTQGIRCQVRPFVSSAFYKILYKKGFFFRKTFFFILSTIKRISDIPAALQSDIIFIHLEAYPLGPPLYEYFFALCGKKIIYDIDDAIYLRKTSPTNFFVKYLKYSSKIPHIIKLATSVITCNAYLADYAKRFNKKVAIIHTGVDTNKFRPSINKNQHNKLTIGWIGSHSTAKYLKQLKNVFSRLAEKYSFSLKIIGADKYDLYVPKIEITTLEWKLDDEVAQFQSLDIGVYPLPDDEWVLGKTGFKTIQFMSVGIPCVVSNVGTNPQIVKDGINGFLAKTEEEWVEKLSRLIENPGLRKTMGTAGRETIIKRFSLEVNAPKYFAILKETSKM